MIVETVQRSNEADILALLKSETIWYCGECLSCKTRCPRNNTPGYIVQALRNLSQELGFFTESERGRQQLEVKRIIGGYLNENIGTPDKPDFLKI
jgi:heterodisulfide reductase subunit C